jgi:hypothetical protein
MYEETVSVEQLFEEELEALEEQHQRLIDENTFQSRQTAQKIEAVIEYFNLRLDALEYGFEEAYGIGSSKRKTLH